MKKPNNYWTKERCKLEALRYNSKKDFKKNNSGAFSAAYKYHKCLDEICSHMKKIGNEHKRCIYAYEFSDKSVYVGLTYNIDVRNQKHLKRGTVYNYIQKNPEYILKQLTDYLMLDDAIKMENNYVMEYSKNNWNILNKVKTGGLGNCKKKWTKENCKIEALKYEHRNEFCKNNSGAYRASLKNGWLDEICEHMINRTNWSKNNCEIEALKYKSRFEFSKKCKPAYMSALNNNWLNEICKHMGDKKILRDYWTHEKCKEESKKYNSRGEFSIKSSYSYKISRINNWLDEFFPKK